MLMCFNQTPVMHSKAVLRNIFTVLNTVLNTFRKNMINHNRISEENPEDLINLEENYWNCQNC